MPTGCAPWMDLASTDLIQRGAPRSFAISFCGFTLRAASPCTLTILPKCLPMGEGNSRLLRTPRLDHLRLVMLDVREQVVDRHERREQVRHHAHRIVLAK